MPSSSSNMPSKRRSRRFSSWNPLAFVPAQVSLITSVVYLALFALLLWTHLSLPPAPPASLLKGAAIDAAGWDSLGSEASDGSKGRGKDFAGVNMTAAWKDLAVLSDGFHPWNSRRNGEVRAYLLERIEEILKANGVGFKVVEQTVDAAVDEHELVSGRVLDGGSLARKSPVDGSLADLWLRNGSLDHGSLASNPSTQSLQRARDVVRVVDEFGIEMKKKKKGGKDEDDEPMFVTVFNDERTNVTFVDEFHRQPWTCYAESENILVYIRGSSDDEADDWWKEDGGDERRYTGKGGVLVNAHFDSVSTGYGATDDGVGVVTILQLLSHFTASKANRPKRGIVLLLNEGEEPGLYGAHNYVRHSLSQFPRTFLNLEGAGAGGRATLFRSTDAEVTRFYAKSPLPFGSVVSGDGFKQGLIRSGTDYSVFVDSLGLRGLDVAFFEPRSRYHTDQDDLRDTSLNSLWHMLSASLATVEAMTSYEGDQFEGEADRDGRFELGRGSSGVWFDLFGRVFAVLRLHTLFALSVTLLVAGPVILVTLEIVITKSDRWYPLSRRQYLGASEDEEPVHFSGVRGLFRFPIAFVISTAAVFALAYLLAKINPFIVCSSEYAVWAMMLCAWIAVAWFFCAGADRVRPTALQRMYILIWMYALSWILLVAITVGENNFKIASGYLIVVYHATLFLATLISHLELFALPTKTAFMEHMLAAEEEVESSSVRPESRYSRTSRGHGEVRAGNSTVGDEEDDATESTSLLGASRSQRSGGTFTRIAKSRQTEDGEVAEMSDDRFLNKAYGDEQAWSSSLPRWLWILQFLIIGPINIILIGQVALLVTSAVHMTPADGNSPLTIYLLIAGLTVLILLPLMPFLHRVRYQIPTLLFCIFVGCLVYNLLAFPFTRDARMKFYFSQRIDLKTGVNNVTLTGLDGYVQEIVHSIPSAMGQDVRCAGDLGHRTDLHSCSWHGIQSNVTFAAAAGADAGSLKKGDQPSPWLEYNVSHHGNVAQFSVRGQKTKTCRLTFDEPVADVVIADAGLDARFPSVPLNGSSEVRLYGRDWEKAFQVNVSWAGDTPAKGKTGSVICSWADANEPGRMPAFDEVVRFAPVWAAVAEYGDALIEGFERFEV